MKTAALMLYAIVGLVYLPSFVVAPAVHSELLRPIVLAIFFLLIFMGGLKLGELLK